MWAMIRFAVLLAGLQTACSGSGLSSTDGSGDPGDGGTTNNLGAPNPALLPGEVGDRGSISVTSSDGPRASDNTWSANASFFKGSEVPCEVVVAGGCLVMNCRPFEPHFPAVGNIAIDGGAEAVRLIPASGGQYARVGSVEMRKLWSGGETLTFSGAGGEFPAFSERVQTPHVRTIKSPPTPPTAIDRSSDLELTWEQGPDPIFVQLTVWDSRAVLYCRYDGGTTHGILPAAALSELPRSSNTLMLVYSAQIKKATVGSAQIDLEAQYLAHDRNGYPYFRDFIALQ